MEPKHFEQTLGAIDLTVTNFPTIQDNRKDPDQYHLPRDTDLIPHDFGDLNA